MSLRHPVLHNCYNAALMTYDCSSERNVILRHLFWDISFETSLLRHLFWDISFETSLCSSERNASWNPAEVEPIHWKPADINPGSLNSGTNRKVGQFWVDGTNQTKGCIRGRNPTTKKLLGREWLRMKHDCIGVATISRLLKIIGLFCRRAL